MLQKIIDVVKECGGIIKNACAQHVELKNQDRRNLVTEYDLKIQSVLKQKLTEIQNRLYTYLNKVDSNSLPSKEELNQGFLDELNSHKKL